MAHLNTFSHNHHSIYRYDKSHFYDNNLNLIPAFASVGGTSRQLDIYTDIHDSSVNFSGSPLRSYYYPAIGYNTSQQFKENVSNYVDLTGLSVRHAFMNHYACSTTPYFNECGLGKDIDGYGLEANLDNWNFEQYPIVMLTPRHAIMPGHPYDYCNQSRQATDWEDFSCCVAEDGTCTNEAFYTTMYSRLIWMNKDNQITYPFTSYADFKQKLKSRDTVNGIRIRNLGHQQTNRVDCMLIEFPTDVATSSNQIKYYNNILYTKSIPIDVPVYRVRGSGVVVKQQYVLNKFNEAFLSSINDGINDSYDNKWTGDSGSPLILKYQNETVFAGTTDAYEVDDTLKTHILNFISSGNKPEYANLLVFFNPERTIPNTTSQSYNYLGPVSVDLTSSVIEPLNKFPLIDENFRSRATEGYASGNNYKFIAFNSHRALQASELNEIQEHEFSAKSLQLRFNSNWKNSGNGKIPSWNGLIPLDPKSLVVFDPTMVSDFTVNIKFFMQKGWYLERRNSDDFLNRWVYLTQDVNADFNYTNADYVNYEVYIGFADIIHQITKCSNFPQLTDNIDYDPDYKVLALYNGEFRDNSQDYITPLQNVYTCGGDREQLGINGDNYIYTNNTDQQEGNRLIGANYFNQQYLGTVLKIKRNTTNVEICLPNGTLLATNTAVNPNNNSLPNKKIFKSHPDNTFDPLQLSYLVTDSPFGTCLSGIGDWYCTYGSFDRNLPSNVADPFSTPICRNDPVLCGYDGGKIEVLPNKYIRMTTIDSLTSVNHLGVRIPSGNSRAEFRNELPLLAPTGPRKLRFGYNKFDCKVKTKIKINEIKKEQNLVVGMYRTHADGLYAMSVEYLTRGVYSAGYDRIIGFVTELVDDNPRWICMVYDRCNQNAAAWDNTYSKGNSKITDFYATDEHELEVFLSADETYAEFKIDGTIVASFYDKNTLTCATPRPHTGKADTGAQRAVYFGIASRDIHDNPQYDPVTGQTTGLDITDPDNYRPGHLDVIFKDVVAEVNSVVPYQNLSFPQYW